ncbi:MAG: hypothetical protein JWM76_293 [Pseudonocardiales bacterium]|nr:hypothetical protein [Pseudonocardiales bacterium]
MNKIYRFDLPCAAASMVVTSARIAVAPTQVAPAWLSPAVGTDRVVIAANRGRFGFAPNARVHIVANALVGSAHKAQAVGNAGVVNTAMKTATGRPPRGAPS